MSKQMTVQQYASKVGIDAKDKQWIIDNEKDIVVYQDNSKTKGWSALVIQSEMVITILHS